MQRLIYAVTSSASSFDISLFVIDSQILTSVSNGGHAFHGDAKNNQVYCKVLCIEGKRLTHLAILNDLTPSFKLEAWIKDVKENKRLEVIRITKSDPYALHRDINVPLSFHLLIFDPLLDKDTGHVLHIIILHELSAVFDQHYWYRGAIDISEKDSRLIYRQGVRKSHFLMTETATIYKATEIIPSLIDGLILAIPRPVSEFTRPMDQYLEFIECNGTRARLFNEMYPQTEADRQLTQEFRIKVKNMLTSVKHVLDKHKTQFWLSSGTLLGYYRQCDVIHYSIDVDIGVRIEQFHPNIIESLQMADLQLMHKFGRINDSLELSFRNENIKLDIFFFYTDSRTGEMWNGGTDTSTGDKVKYIFPPFKLCWSNFLGSLYRIPCPTLGYIEANYGKNGAWFTPVKEWHWKTSPPNAVANGKWPSSQWSQVIQSFT